MPSHPILDKENKKRRFAARLQQLCKAWKDIAEEPLDKRQRILRSLASGFFQKGYTRTHQINLIDRGVSTLVPFLVEGNPRVLVESRIANLRPWAYITQLAVNFSVENDNLAENVFIPAARNSMVGAAITRTFLPYNRKISYEGEEIKSGKPKVVVIDDSAYIGDVAAKTRQDMVIEGDVYRLPTDYAKELFSKYADWIQPDCKLMEKYSAEEISKPDFNRNKLSVRDYTTFIDLYLYDENIIVTIMPEGKLAKILRTVEWDGPGEGPDAGPYDYLGYKYFPDSIIPLPPAWAWHDLDVTINNLADKMKESAENMKTLFFYTAAAEQIAEKVKNAQHLDTIRIDNFDSIQKVDLGGVNPEMYNWVNYIEQAFTKAGTPSSDIIAGRGAQAPTLGQEQLVYNNATRIINNFYNRFQSFMESIVRKYCWYFWTNPLVYYPVVRDIPGVGEFPAIFSQVDRVGDFYDFVFKVTPYSTQRMSPEIKYQRLMQFMSQWLLPTAQLAAAQGAKIDIVQATKILGDYAGIDNLNQIYQTAIPDELQSIDYKMLPIKNRKEGTFGQTNDSFGATLGSKQSNLQRYETKEKPEQEFKGMTGTK